MRSAAARSMPFVLRSSEAREQVAPIGAGRSSSGERWTTEFACVWFSQGLWPASPQRCLVLCRCAALAHHGGVSRRRCRVVRLVRRPCASAPPCVVRSPRTAPAFGSCLARFGSPELTGGVRSLPGSFNQSVLFLAGLAWQTGAHGMPRGSVPPAA
jgi:hypothetical protein